MYPVAYKTAAAAYQTGIQSVIGGSAAQIVESLGPFVRGLPVVAAFLFGFEATWEFLDWLDEQEKGPLPEGFGTVGTIVQPVAGQPANDHYIPASGWTQANGGGNCLMPWQSWAGKIHFAGWRYQTTCNNSGIGGCATAGGPPNSVAGARMAFMLYELESPFFGFVIQEKWYATGCPATAPSDSPGAVPATPEVPAVRVPVDVDYPVDSPSLSRSGAGVLPERTWDGVRAPPVGWPWAWPKASPKAPDRVIGDGDLVIPGEVPIPQARPGVRDITGVTVDSVNRPVVVSRTRSEAISEIRPAKDRKFANPRILVGLKILMNAVTESRDLVQALWKALPNQCKTKKRGPKGGLRHLRPNEMIADLKYCFHNSDFVYRQKVGKGASYEVERGLEAYVHRALVEVLANEMQDGLFGLVGQQYKKAVRNLYELGLYDRPVGLQMGDRFRPRAGQIKQEKGFVAPPSDDVFHSAASRIIDALW